MPAGASGAAPAEALAPGLWRVPLPSRTPPPWDHTNSYLVADRGVGWWIDAGFDPGDAAALRAVDAALERAEVRTLKGALLTHTHADHVRGVAALQDHLAGRFGAVPAFVHPLELERVEASGPVRALQGGRVLVAGDLTLRALHTPGHAPGHLAFWNAERRAALVGDLLTAEGSVFVGAPDGDVAAYLASLARLGRLDATLLAPGHGPAVRDDPAARIDAVAAHRREREAQVLAALGALAGSAATLARLRREVYGELEPALVRLAERSLEAHLGKLTADGRVVGEAAGEEGEATRYRLS